MPPEGYEPFLATVLENPDDDAPRLVYADWLEERGDSRGDFIRVQCELARLDEDDPRAENLRDRENKLLLTHGETWRAEIPEWARAGCEFRRGFIERVSIWQRDSLLQLAALPKRAPVRSLKLHDVAHAMLPLRRSCALKFATELCFLDERLQYEDLRELLLETPEDEFELALNGAFEVWQEQQEPVATQSEYASELNRLRSLTFLGAALLDGGAARIALAAGLVNLQRLELVRCQMSAYGMRQLFLRENLPSLKVLDLSENNLGDAGAWELARSQVRHALTHLALRDAHLTNQGAHHLAESRILENLQFLDLSQNSIGDDGAKAIARGLTSLRRLVFHDNHITNSGLLALKERFGKGLKV